nr:hypothetical protein BGP89_04945 [Luteimonas sp. JM171]
MHQFTGSECLAYQAEKNRVDVSRVQAAAGGIAEFLDSHSSGPGRRFGDPFRQVFDFRKVHVQIRTLPVQIELQVHRGVLRPLQRGQMRADEFLDPRDAALIA